MDGSQSNGSAGDQEKFERHMIEWNQEKTRRLWDFYGASEVHKSIYFGEMAGNHFARVLRRNGVLRKVRKVVDFSCGTGAIISALLTMLPRGATVEGCDFSMSSVLGAEARNTGLPGFSGVHFLNGFPTQFDSDSVDLLILTEVIEHLDDRSLESLFSEIRRILSPRGYLVLTTPNSEVLERSHVLCPECGCIFHRWQHQRSWSETSLSHALRNYQFKDIRVKSVTWGSEWIDLAFSIFRRKKTGLLALAKKN